LGADGAEAAETVNAKQAIAIADLNEQVIGAILQELAEAGSRDSG
jgi:hypothetical protein